VKIRKTFLPPTNVLAIKGLIGAVMKRRVPSLGIAIAAMMLPLPTIAQVPKITFLEAYKARFYKQTKNDIVPSKATSFAVFASLSPARRLAERLRRFCLS
jgi:hypothetical protein